MASRLSRLRIRALPRWPFPGRKCGAVLAATISLISLRTWVFP
ncbi:hypothetical protein [Desulfonema ishimotonii]|nr:hypothetical protein [Desulfonema ishimotonii]